MQSASNHAPQVRQWLLWTSSRLTPRANSGPHASALLTKARGPCLPPFDTKLVRCPDFSEPLNQIHTDELCPVRNYITVFYHSPIPIHSLRVILIHSTETVLVVPADIGHRSRISLVRRHSKRFQRCLKVGGMSGPIQPG
jgi:hypothetical protein